MEVALFHGSVTAAAIALRHTDEITLIKCLIFYNHIYLLCKGINPGGAYSPSFWTFLTLSIYWPSPSFWKCWDGLSFLMLYTCACYCSMVWELICIQTWWCPTHKLLHIVMLSHQELDTGTTISHSVNWLKWDHINLIGLQANPW
jgi:hypothetical protein